MARKVTLKSGTIDLLSEAEKKATAKEAAAQQAAKNGEPEVISYQRSQLNYARKENQKIQSERGDKIHPLVIAMSGVDTPVVDPNAIWAYKTPPVLRSPRDLVAFVIAKQDPSVLAVIDFETWQLLAGVLHHAVSLRFNDDGILLTKENRKDVKFHRTYEEIDDFFCGLMVELINKCMRDPAAGREGKVYAHNGSNFDYVGFALSKGLDRNTKGWREVIALDKDGNDKKYKIYYEIKSFSGKSKLTLYTGKGRGGEYRIHLIDSYHLLPAPVSALGDKGVTPEQFTNPLRWINKHRSKTTGLPYALTEQDVRPYLYLAHKRSLESFKDSGEISDIAYEALELWRATFDDADYSCDDVIILANALKRWATKYRLVAQPLAKLLGQDAVDSLNPFSFNTSSTAGFALSVAYWYESRLEEDENGSIQLKRSLQFQQKNRVYALIESGLGYGKILSPEEVQEELDAGTKVQRHGIVKHRDRVLIEYPIWTTSVDNRFSRMAQNGSQTTVFKTIAHKVLEVDSNSAFPAAMAKGCEMTVVKAGYTHNGLTIGREWQVKLNALVGFEEPGYKCSMPTKVMIETGIATPEIMLNEHGHQVTMWVVRGREKILHMLQIRTGEFSVVLPPSLSPELHTLPGLSIRTPGRGLDSRLVNPRITQPAILMLRGECIAAFASTQTIDDEAMVVFLCEVGINEKGRTAYRDRSRHGPIMGVAMDKSGKVFGTPHMPHKKFVEVVYNIRLEEKKRAKKAREDGNLSLAEQLSAEATMTKLILNGGGYGMYAQGLRPEVDFDLGNIDECIEIIESLAGLDPSWSGMQECVKKLAPEYHIEGEACAWPDLYAAIKIYLERKAEIENDVNARQSAIDHINRLRISAFRQLFTAWADNQITTFTTYNHKSTELDDRGERKSQIRGIITSAEETAAHAIRPYASAVVAKAAVNLHMGQLAVLRSPFGLAYSDTDSLHAETGIIKPFDNEKAIDLVYAEYQKAYGSAPDDHVTGLQRLMNDHAIDTGKIFTSIMELYGLKTGELLGQWGLEKHTYAKGLVSPVMDNKAYTSNRTFYLGAKVYIDTDMHDNAARTKVRSIPKLNPVHPAVFEGFVTSIPSLADRRGLDQENFRKVKLDSTREVKFGKIKRRVTMLFSSPRRKYHDTGTSEPFSLEYTPGMTKRIMSGELISSESLARDAMTGIGLDENFETIRGLEQAYMTYTKEVKIQGRSFDDVSHEVSQDILAKERLINSQQMSETFNPQHKLLILSKDVGDEMAAMQAEWDEISTYAAKEE